MKKTDLERVEEMFDRAKIVYEVSDGGDGFNLVVVGGNGPNNHGSLKRLFAFYFNKDGSLDSATVD